MSEGHILVSEEKEKKIVFNPALAGASAVGTVALVGSPSFATASPVADLQSQVSGLGTLATAAAAVAGVPIILYFGYRIVKRVLAGGT